MKILRAWLEDFVVLPKEKNLSEILTSLGFEVEGIDSAAFLHELVVLGYVKETYPHPQADRLKVCSVSIGSEDLTIVCGAPNARAGIHVAVALPGAQWDEFKIKITKIRSVTSQGMLCGLDELGLGFFQEDSSGIWEISLSNPLALGQPLAKIWDKIYPQATVWDVAIPPNRGDALGYQGIARELIAYGFSPKEGAGTQNLFPKSWDEKFWTSPCEFSVNIDPSCSSAYFSWGLLKNVSTGASPSWVQQRLKASGFTPVNLLVDASQYLLLSTGQPSHIYDRGKIPGTKLVLKKHWQGPMDLLNGEAVELHEEDWAVGVESSSKPLALAGVMGGAESAVSSETHEVLLEVGSFAPEAIRATQRRHGLSSEAGYRFERGSAWGRPEYIHELFLLIENFHRIMGYPLPSWEGGGYTGVMPSAPAPMALRMDRLQSILGFKISSKECEEILTRGGYQLLDQKNERFLWQPPWWRRDLHREVDMVEDVARFYGYDRIPSHPPYGGEAGHQDPFISWMERISLFLSFKGFHEIRLEPFVGAKAMEALRVSPGHPLWPSLELKNPLTCHENFLQTTGLCGLLDSLKNLRGKGPKRLWTWTRGYGFDPQASFPWKGGPSRLWTPQTQEEARPGETLWLSGLWQGPWVGDWKTPHGEIHFYHLKTLWIQLFQMFGQDGTEACFHASEQDLPFLHPKAGGFLENSQGKAWGWVGEIHPQVQKTWDLEGGPVFAFEFHAEMLYDLLREMTFAPMVLSRFPSVTRDLACLAPISVKYEVLEGCLRRLLGQGHFVQFHLFDVYEGDQIPAGMKSFAMSCLFQKTHGTLTDKEVEQSLEEILAALRSHGISQR